MKMGWRSLLPSQLAAETDRPSRGRPREPPHSRAAFVGNLDKTSSGRPSGQGYRGGEQMTRGVQSRSMVNGLGRRLEAEPLGQCLIAYLSTAHDQTPLPP